MRTLLLLVLLPSMAFCQSIISSPLLFTMPLLDASGTFLSVPHVVKGSCALSLGQCTVNFSGNAIFTSASTYTCSSNDVSGVAVVTSAVPQSGSQIKAFGTGSNTVQFTCIGN